MTFNIFPKLMKIGISALIMLIVVLTLNCVIQLNVFCNKNRDIQGPRNTIGPSIGVSSSSWPWTGLIFHIWTQITWLSYA